MELIRELMLRFEADDRSLPDGRTGWEVAYHVKQLIDAGLVEGEVVNGFASDTPGRPIPKDFIIHDITWKGHDFIMAVRDDNVWKRTKDYFRKNAIAWTVDLIVDFLRSQARNALGL